MDLLKKIFPFSFLEKKDVATLVIHIVAHVITGAVTAAVVAIAANIPFVGFLFGLLSSLVGAYFTAGTVFTILNYSKVIK